MEMTFRLPDLNDEELLRDYVREHRARGEANISASMSLAKIEYADWVEQMARNAREGDGEFGRMLLFLCFDGARLVGLLCVRHELPRPLREKFGDIGYGVRPSERRKGYATRMLRHALDVCREMGMRDAIVGCYSDNAASAATIRACGGRLYAERDSYTPGRPSQYYRIEL